MLPTRYRARYVSATASTSASVKHTFLLASSPRIIRIRVEPRLRCVGDLARGCDPAVSTAGTLPWVVFESLYPFQESQRGYQTLGHDYSDDTGPVEKARALCAGGIDRASIDAGLPT